MDKPKINYNLPLITSVFFCLTQRCNLRCKYCFVDKYPKDMTIDVAMDAVKFLITNAEIESKKRNKQVVPAINFFGGEPTLKWDEIIVPVTDYIRNVYKKPFDLSMTTNGTLLTPERWEYIKKNKISLLMSIDGDAETTALNRPYVGGRSSFEDLEKNIAPLLEYQPNATFRMTLDHDNGKALLHNCKFAIEKGYNNIFFIPNVFIDWTQEEKDDMFKALHDVALYYIDEYEKGTKISINQFDSAFKNIKRINRNYRTKSFRSDAIHLPACGKCGLGGNMFASVGFDGKLYSCQEMAGNRETGDKFCIGDIYNGTDNAKRKSICESFCIEKVRCKNSERCKTCKLVNICDGGCSINNFFATGDLNVCPEIICEFYQACIKEAEFILNVMAEKKNTKFREYFNKI